MQIKACRLTAWRVPSSTDPSTVLVKSTSQFTQYGDGQEAGRRYILMMGLKLLVYDFSPKSQT